MVMAGGIRDGGIAPDPKKRVSEWTVRRLDRYQLQRGDILLVRVGDTKRFGTVTGKVAGWLMGDTCIRVRPGSGGHAGVPGLVPRPSRGAGMAGRQHLARVALQHQQGNPAAQSAAQRR
ncbi:hypothetical protein Vqi01_41460 [Micromonospora qiuiae]|uniref:KOW domain-containing protein n=1 Tax=Micromonospora qiuiae TaxID=502268 RepID=A0ABQ4JFB0_9ACTN|nr:hypothetical protein Vqi01_41460 [Micromonospora qiuiae]